MTQDFLQKMQQRYEELTGIPADEASDIGVRLRILAEQLELLYQQLEEEKKQAFAQTATGLALEQHAQQKGLLRFTMSRRFYPERMPKGTRRCASGCWTAFGRSATGPIRRFITTGR